MHETVKFYYMNRLILPPPIFEKSFKSLQHDRRPLMQEQISNHVHPDTKRKRKARLSFLIEEHTVSGVHAINYKQPL